jgi:iron complex transport system ATP-binding protein
MMGRNVPVRCAGLEVGYRKPVLSGIDAEIPAGQFVALLGPNGAGKTTLLRTLSRHLKPLGGRVELGGRELATIPAIDLARLVAVCLTDTARPPLLSVAEYVALGRYPYTDFLGRLTPHDARVVEEALAAVAADGLADRMVEQLSDGERQKAVLARALAQEPRVMLLDEPTAHLDLKHRIEVMGILRGLCRSRGLTVIASLHDVDVAAKVADRVMLVKDGRMTAFGMPEAVLSAPAVAELYDFRAADFDARLGGIELRGSSANGRAFVAAGRGSGAAVFRLLAKHGFAISTGVLAEGDLDAFVADALGAECFVRPAAANGDDRTADAAFAALARCDFVVDCGLPDAPCRALIGAAVARGLPVYPAQAEGEGLAVLAEAIDRRRNPIAERSHAS